MNQILDVTKWDYFLSNMRTKWYYRGADFASEVDLQKGRIRLEILTLAWFIPKMCLSL